MKTSPSDSRRRGFLAAAAALPALAVAALVARRHAPPAALPADPAPQPPTGSGYRETEHVRKYYRTAGYF